MSRKIILLFAGLGILVGALPAWAAMTNTQAKALALTAYHHPGFKVGDAALSKLESAANAGAPAARDWIGTFYYMNHHYDKANFWYEKAAEQGYADAESDLGYAYDCGKGVPKSYAKAIYWYKKAAAQGSAKAQYNLGYGYNTGEGVSKNYAKANYWYRKAAQQGYAYAESNLGAAYDHGDGVPKSYIKANYWYKKAAEQGNAIAQYDLGYDYNTGEGVPKSCAKANYWYMKAAEQGFAEAELNLGFDYYKCEGVPQDTARAMFWWKKAAAQGDSMARKTLHIVLEREKYSREQARSPLKLFGIGLKGASRDDIEPALAKAGLTPHKGHVGSKWWFDEYNVNGKLSGANELDVGYTQNNYFALAEYIFPSSMDAGQVGRIINMVRAKYGQPSSVSGDYGLGPVTAVWNVGDGMEVKVRRSWPDTTTYLDLIDSRAQGRMKHQLAMQKKRQLRKQANSQSNAF